MLLKIFEAPVAVAEAPVFGPAPVLLGRARAVGPQHARARSPTTAAIVLGAYGVGVRVQADKVGGSMWTAPAVLSSAR
jgi:hypothetical protein